MPWSPSDAVKYKKGLSPEQAAKWAKIANGILADCQSAMGNKESGCEGKAIRIANSKVGGK